MLPNTGSAYPLPRFLHDPVDRATLAFLVPPGASGFDFASPAGEPALVAADSVSWRVFKNPLTLFIGGIAAVILELAEPRVRAGVWDHSSFRTAPLKRMQRTGLAAMVTVYGARSKAEAMIAGVRRMHDRVAGMTPAGARYTANDPELLDWVQATASYGFLEAYHLFAQPLSPDEMDRFYAEGSEASTLYGAANAPNSRAELDQLFGGMRLHLERSPTIFEFLRIMGEAAILPAPLRPLQGVLVKAGVEILPSWAREIIGLDAAWRLPAWQTRLIQQAARAADRVLLRSQPPVQACLRLGLPEDYLYRDVFH
jgi:uncharacterized protein (DUF2236 family)